MLPRRLEGRLQGKKPLCWPDGQLLLTAVTLTAVNINVVLLLCRYFSLFEKITDMLYKGITTNINRGNADVFGHYLI